MSQVNWLKRLLGLKSLDDSAMALQQPGQKLMTLEERMVFRREMVFESIREVLANHGVPPLSYKLNVARLDARGHRYAVMVDLLAPSAGRVLEASGEWNAMESQIAHAAATRYRVKVSNVYWRIERQGFDAPAVANTATVPVADRRRPTQEKPVSPPNWVGPVPARRSTDMGQDGFPDTVVEDRRSPAEPIGADELAAFEQAMKQGQEPLQPVKVGSRTYQTDFMPLV